MVTGQVTPDLSVLTFPQAAAQFPPSPPNTFSYFFLSYRKPPGIGIGKPFNLLTARLNDASRHSFNKTLPTGGKVMKTVLIPSNEESYTETLFFSIILFIYSVCTPGRGRPGTSYVSLQILIHTHATFPSLSPLPFLPP